mmetsp:Transcript_19897/g.39844  ORF Transcript_19897/g.39844 Transcript_19897/m.39844 type:complete len:219 (-) Transcript_19897:579-1235(-)
MAEVTNAERELRQEKHPPRERQQEHPLHLLLQRVRQLGSVGSRVAGLLERVVEHVGVAEAHVGGGVGGGVVVVIEVVHDAIPDGAVVVPDTVADAGEDAKDDGADELDEGAPLEGGEVRLADEGHAEGDDDASHKEAEGDDGVVKVVPVSGVVGDVKTHGVVNAHDLEGHYGVGEDETAKEPHHVLLEHVLFVCELRGEGAEGGHSRSLGLQRRSNIS